MNDAGRLAPVMAIAAIITLSAGCFAGATMPSRHKYLAAHPETTAEARAAILSGTLVMGMTEPEVVASLGMPDHVNRSTYSFGTTVQFCYGDIGNNLNFNRYRYVYFENGRVTSWRE